MRVHPYFENLDTSFVDLEALVRYLRRRNFVGKVEIDFTGYHCEIAFTAEARLRAAENDRISGRSSVGKEAFKNIIGRAKEPGGMVNVLQLLNDKQKNANETLMDFSAIGRPTSVEVNGNGLANGDGLHVKYPSIKSESEYQPSPLLKHLGFPPALTNEIEDIAPEGRDSEDEFDLLVDLTGDLLKTIDGALERAGLDFSAAFGKACKDLSGEYPFLDPEKRLFIYSCGVVYINDGTDLRQFRKGLGEALANIFERLNGAPKLGKAYRFAAQKVRYLVQFRKEQFDRVRLTSQIERALKA